MGGGSALRDVDICRVGRLRIRGGQRRSQPHIPGRAREHAKSEMRASEYLRRRHNASQRCFVSVGRGARESLRLDSARRAFMAEYPRPRCEYWDFDSRSYRELPSGRSDSSERARRHEAERGTSYLRLVEVVSEQTRHRDSSGREDRRSPRLGCRWHCRPLV